MTDLVDSAARSRMMSRIRSRDTTPEMLVRKGLFRMGYRYRLHLASLPGKPDIVLKKYKALILVNGCFWHGHGCKLFKWPKTRTSFWRDKITTNMERDRRNIEKYRRLDWRVLIVWECALKGSLKKDPVEVVDLISEWLKSDSPYLEIKG